MKKLLLLLPNPISLLFLLVLVCCMFLALTSPAVAATDRLPNTSPLLVANQPISPIFLLAPPQTMPMPMPPGGGAPEEEEVGVGKANQHHHSINKRMLVISLIVVSSILFALLILIFSFLFCCWIHRLNKHHSHSHRSARGGGVGGAGLSILGKFSSMRIISNKGGGGGVVSISTIQYPLLEAATNNFSQDNILGEGGVGCVYRACFDNNFVAAVKKINSGDDEHPGRKFENEVDLLSKIQHPNIISLLGYCIHQDTTFIIYELMHAGSLETQLHGPSHGSALTWHIRMKIALDAARGLEYLHENCNPPVIHRDLKSSNILLGSDFTAKLSDFGLAVISGTQNKYNVKLSGTLGYVAPEYLLDGKLTDKSDVYAFGVILLELLLGRKPVENITPSQCQSIVTWAMPQLTDKSKLPSIVDPVIRNTMDLKHLYQVAAVAVLCVQPEPSYRPLITDVLHSLVPLVPLELGGTLRVT